MRSIPDGDDRERQVCNTCGYVAYDNPKIIVGSVIQCGERVLLCRRAIEPRRGYWTLPAGFLEHGETAGEGATREAFEEACASISLDGILAIFSISRIGQVQIIFRARLEQRSAVPSFRPGPESLDVRLFRWDEIPWPDIAFPSVRWALRAWREAADRPLGQPWANPAEDPRGSVQPDHPMEDHSS